MEIVLIYGGKSAEHEISVLTAQAIAKNIDYMKYTVQPVYITQQGDWLAGPKLNKLPQMGWDFNLSPADQAEFKETNSTGLAVVPTDVLNASTIVFPALHGPNGEDGTIQGLFESLNVPYVGAGVLASATAMDKIISKYLFEKAGIPQLPYHALRAADWEKDPEAALDVAINDLDLPVFVKPANLGSSVGISRADSREDLKTAIDLALQFDRRVVLEKALDGAREIELAVMGNDDPQVSVPGELVKEQGFYDYDEKYINNTVEMAIPAPLSKELVSELQDYAKAAYLIIDGSGLTRCDFFITADEDIYINEVNTMPGFTQFSMYPSLWEATGKSYSQLIADLLELALSRYEAKQKRLNQVEH